MTLATSGQFLDYVLERLSGLEEVRVRPMMGEYLLYGRDRYAAGLCDNRLLVKPVPSARALLPEAALEPPYEGAQPMLVVDCLEDRARLEQLFTAIWGELPPPKPKKGRKKA